MGRRGPVSKPSALKRAQGVRPSRINASEPVPTPGQIEPPEDMSEGALAIWERLAPDLERAGVLTSWDVDLFGEYCETLATVRQARKVVQLSLLVGSRDHPRVNPAWRIQRDALGLALALGRQFGLTPSARSGLGVPRDEEAPALPGCDLTEEQEPTD
jgi:P27 family predicted phage terminase small subunit